MKYGFYAKAIIPAILLLTGYQAFNQEKPLFTINDQPVYTNEFTRILNKNKSNIQGQQPDIRESLELYINFRLKVLEAESLGYDTTAKFKTELEQYRVQLAKPYLMDQQVTEDLVKEAYERSKWEVRASHIMAGVKMDAPAADTLLAYKKAMNIRERLLNGENFADLAREVSDDPSAKTNGGDLGYFTVLWMVYPFENAVYNMKAGEISMPVRTQFGYHILTLTDKRPSRGKIQVSSIYKAFDFNSSEADKARIKEDITNIYLQLKSGADFADMFRKYSDDRNQSTRGDAGYWIGINEREPVFEEAAFALKNPGDISEPVLTSMGYFIIRLLDRKPMESFEEAKSGLYYKISRMPDRAMKSEEAVVDKLKKEYHFKVNQANLEEFYRLVDPSVFEGRWDANPALAKTGVLFTIGDKNVLQDEFAKFLALNNRQSTVRTIAEYVDDKFREFSKNFILKYEESKLIDKYPEYRDLYEEFRDGNLFFEIADKMVWSKASQDSAGLVKFFNERPSSYMWPERLDAVIIDCKGTNNRGKMIEDFKAALGKNCKNGCTGSDVQKILSGILEKYSGNSFDIQDKMFGKGDQYIIDQIKWKKGTSEVFDNPDSQSFVLVNRIVAPQPKKLEDIKGIVIADYQEYLDQEWIKALRQKYQVKINEDVLSKIK